MKAIELYNIMKDYTEEEFDNLKELAKQENTKDRSAIS